MLRLRWFGRKWPYWLFAVCLAGLLAASTLAPSYEDCATNHHKPAADPDQRNSQPEMSLSFGDHASIYMDCEGEFIHANEGVITALSTIFIALFTLALWRSTDRLWTAGEKQLRQARSAASDQYFNMTIANTAAQHTANAARKSAAVARDEFNATYRPEIIVHTFEMAREEVVDGFAICAQFVVVNKGASDAIIRQISGTIVMTEKLRPGIVTVPLGFAGHRLAAGEVLRNVAIKGEALDTAIVDMNSGFGVKSTTGEAMMWCVGLIVYEDAIGRRRETGFCRSYDVLGECWVKNANPDAESNYEYAY